MKLDKKFFNELKEQIEKDWGRQEWCIESHHIKGHSPLCGQCQVWLAFESLHDLYEVDYKMKKNETIPLT